MGLPYTMEDFRRDYLKEHLEELSPEERLEGLSPEKRLEGLSVEGIERFLEKLKGTQSSGRRKTRRKKQ